MATAETSREKLSSYLFQRLFSCPAMQNVNGGMLDAADRQFHSVSQRNKVKIQLVNNQLNDLDKIMKKQHQK